MKIAATIQARMGSIRFPGKTLMEVAGKPILGHIVERIKKSKTIDDVIVATSLSKKDDIIESFCSKNDIRCFRGSEDDVRGRILQALAFYEADVNVEMYGDNPCPDAGLIDEIVAFYLGNKYDYVSNFIKITYPPGLEVQVYKTKVLEKAALLSDEQKYKEHVSLYIYTHKDVFSCFNYEAPENLKGYEDVHIELDTAEDFEFVKFVYENLYYENHDFTTHDILRLLDKNSHIKGINKKVPRKWQIFR